MEIAQGFHEILPHCGQLDRYVHVKLIQQGEGLVNSVGAFSGKSSLVKMSLKNWGGGCCGGGQRVGVKSQLEWRQEPRDACVRSILVSAAMLGRALCHALFDSFMRQYGLLVEFIIVCAYFCVMCCFPQKFEGR